MQYRFFTIMVFGSEEVEQELNKFCASNRLAAVEKHFVADGDRSFWSICVGYVQARKENYGGRNARVDYREVLNDTDFAMFARLRTLRKSLSEQEGVPAYALFTNEQLAEMVRSRVDSLAKLGAIDGVGKARIEKYGKQFVSLLAQEFSKGMASAGGRDSGWQNGPGLT